jgi:uncharacterized protein YrrD
MHKVSDLVGKPIVSSTGEKVGSVSDVLVDEAATHVVGLVVGGGMFHAERVLPFSDVETVGRDAVIARSAEHVVGPQQWREQQVPASRTSGLRNRPVMTAGGRQLGAVRDIYIDDQNGNVQGYEIGSPRLGGLSERRTMLTRSDGVAVGPDAVLVPENGDGVTDLTPDRDR